jgi:hypothetical protein
MENFRPIHLQEVIFGSSDKKLSKEISKLEKEGKIRKIAQRLYSSNLTDSPEDIVKRNLWQILSHFYAGAILSHRSAFEFQLTKAGHIFLTYTYTKKVNLPGVRVRLLEGNNPIEGDNLFFGKLYASQKARAFLENLQATKNAGPESKCLSLPQIEEKLEEIIRVHGEDELNKLRDRAAEVAVLLNMQPEFEKLTKLISALLTTKSHKSLSSPLAIARAIGAPYDAVRLELFSHLFRALQTKEFKNIPDKNNSLRSFRNFAFFESYFSNYIEGTIFEVEEAKQIVETNKPLPARHGDSHDVLGTYQLVSNKQEMTVIPNSAEAFLKILSYRHGVLLNARIDKNPGLFKDKNNFAGQTTFVDYNLVRGTLVQAFNFYKALRTSIFKGGLYDVCDK